LRRCPWCPPTNSNGTSVIILQIRGQPPHNSSHRTLHSPHPPIRGSWRRSFQRALSIRWRSASLHRSNINSLAEKSVINSLLMLYM
jgi:hypothetical protein